MLAAAAADGRFWKDQLWVTDGTPGGTQRLFDGADALVSSSNGQLFFVASGTGGYRLGVTDGTPAGTRADVELLEQPRVVGTVGRYLVFTHDPDGSATASTEQLWASDGTPEGTHPLSSEAEPVQRVSGATEWDGRLYFYAGFNAWAADTRIRLYSTDGSAGDLRALTDPSVDERFDPMGSPLLAWQGHLYFNGHDDLRGHELWRTDGSQAGTVLVANVAADTQQRLGSRPYLYAATPDAVLFNTTRYGSLPLSGGLWRSDGTEGGTVQVADVDLFGHTSFAEVSGQWFFAARSPSATGPGGFQLWATNGAAGGSRRVSDAVDPTVSRRPEDSSLRPMNALGGRLLFAGKTDDHPVAPWASDGTEAGTERLADAYLWQPNFTSVGDRAYFVADLNGRGDEDRQLFVTDGTRAGTRVIAPVAATTTDDPFGEDNARVLALGPTLLMNADFDGTGRGLWALHPTP